MKNLYSLTILPINTYIITFIISIITINDSIGQSFSPAISYSTGADSFPEGIALGDVNGDGQVDIVSANSSTGAGTPMGNMGTISILIKQPSGFASATTYSVGYETYPMDIALGDVNGDGQIDIVEANFGTYSQASSVGVLLGQGNGKFASVIIYDFKTSSGIENIALKDVNDDGRLDIISANQNNSAVGVLLGQATGFAPVKYYSTGPASSPYALALGDINSDGHIDIVTANSNNNKVSVLLGLANGSFSSFSAYPVGGSSPQGIAIGDLNGDGHLDIVTANAASSNVSVLLGQANGGFKTPSIYSPNSSGAPFSTAKVELHDVNSDGILDIITSINLKAQVGGVGILLGRPNGFSSATTYAMGRYNNPGRLAVGDLDNDGRPDIVQSNRYTNEVNILLNSGAFLNNIPTVSMPSDIAIYPNPSHIGFTVVPGAAKVKQAELYNALGQAVDCTIVGLTKGINDFWVETSTLCAGLYTLRLQVGNIFLTKKIVVN